MLVLITTLQPSSNPHKSRTEKLPGTAWHGRPPRHPGLAGYLRSTAVGHERTAASQRSGSWHLLLQLALSLLSSPLLSAPTFPSSESIVRSPLKTIEPLAQWTRPRANSPFAASTAHGRWTRWRGMGSNGPRLSASDRRERFVNGQLQFPPLTNRRRLCLERAGPPWETLRNGAVHWPAVGRL